MGYRFEDIPKGEGPLPRFEVRNGATARISFGCYYLKRHDSQLHDHMHWPRPGHPDDICQLDGNVRLWRTPDKAANLDPIKLGAEGYNAFTVQLDDETLPITASAQLRSDSVNIVNVSMATAFDVSAFTNGKPIEAKFTVFCTNSQTNTVDAICRGVLVVLPGRPITSSNSE